MDGRKTGDLGVRWSGSVWELAMEEVGMGGGLRNTRKSMKINKRTDFCT